jgi:hypothetical protein
MAHEMHWRISGTDKADMKKIDEWCKKSGQYHKQLNSHTLQELPFLITQFQEMYLKDLKRL